MPANHETPLDNICGKAQDQTQRDTHGHLTLLGISRG